MRITDELRQRRTTTRPLAQFVLSGLVAVSLLGLVAVEIMRREGQDEAIRQAQQTARLVGNGIVAPNVDRGLLRGDRESIAAMDAVVRDAVLQGPVVRIKLWDATGRVVYSDEPRLIGNRYELDEEAHEALYRNSVQAELSDLQGPENRFERSGDRELLEVYLGVRAPDGTPLLLEVYERFSSVTASGRRLWLAFAPALLGALLLLQIAQVPLAYSLLRRLRKGQEEREALLHRALDAAENERSRIARDLHDGAVQDLAGVSFTLAAAADRLERGGEDETATLVEQAADDTRRSVRELRTLLVDLYPPSLHQQGLAAALADLLAPLASRGMETALRADPGMRLPEDAERTLFRAAQEALRNVTKHAKADRVEVTVDQRNGNVALTVSDDGRGPGDAVAGEGHLGLRMVSDLAGDVGGEFRLASREGGGTTFCFEVPG
jgi:two-component system, NarL family, sensor kinase